MSYLEDPFTTNGTRHYTVFLDQDDGSAIKIFDTRNWNVPASIPRGQDAAIKFALGFKNAHPGCAAIEICFDDMMGTEVPLAFVDQAYRDGILAADAFR